MNKNMRLLNCCAKSNFRHQSGYPCQRYSQHNQFTEQCTSTLLNDYGIRTKERTISTRENAQIVNKQTIAKMLQQTKYKVLMKLIKVTYNWSASVLPELLELQKINTDGCEDDKPQDLTFLSVRLSAQKILFQMNYDNVNRFFT